MSSLATRRKKLMEEAAADPGMWIPGLGENKPRPRELGGTVFGYVPDAFSNNLPTLPSESSTSPRSGMSATASSTAGSSRSSSPHRTETADDSSQMKDALWQPSSPSEEQKQQQQEVVEEVITAVDSSRLEAVPFCDFGNCKSFLIQGGLVINHDASSEVDVLVEDGKIKEVGENLEVPDEDCKVIDAKGKFVMPGGIDFGTNLQQRKGAEVQVADDFESGTKAALVGGTTMVVDLVLPEREESLVEAFKAWKESAEDKSCCDFAFKVAVPQWNDNIKDDIGELVKKEGVNVIKVYMSDKDLLMLKNEDLLDAFKAIKDLGAVVEVHAENGEIVAENEKRLLARGITGPEGHLMARPEEVEEEAATRACAFARQVNVPLVISGPTAPGTASIIEKARKSGQPVMGAALAASLALDGSHIFNSSWSHAASFVTSPPLRDNPSYPSKLMRSLALDQGLSIVMSDHKSYNTTTKEFCGKESFTKIPKGLNGVEDRMSIVWEKGVESDKIMEMERFVAVTSSNVAQALNIYPKKGRIQVDSDADIVIWNKNNLREISSRTQSQAGDFNIFEGIQVHGAPEYVLSRGKMVVFEYQVSAEPGSGEFVELCPYPKALYDVVNDFAKTNEKLRVERETKEVRKEDNPAQPRINSADFGITTPRRSIIEEPIMNKRLGIYQRPMSAHGIRNQQDSTFSLAGGVDDAERRASVKINAPPGGEGRAFW